MFKKSILALAVLTSAMFTVASPASALPRASVDGASAMPIEHVLRPRLGWHHHSAHRHGSHSHGTHRSHQ
jgi:hypothetical protein